MTMVAGLMRIPYERNKTSEPQECPKTRGMPKDKSKRKIRRRRNHEKQVEK
jgi:hypothetical protein